MSQINAMNIASSQISNQAMRDAGPPLALLAILYAVLFNAGLYPVTAMASKSYWPGPWESADVIVPYFQTHAGPVLSCLFLQFGATICLGLFCAAVVSRLQYLGVRSAGPWIALFGGFLTGLQRSGGEPGGVDDDSSQRGADSVCSIGALLFFLCFRRSGILRSDGTVYGGSIGPLRVFETAAQVGHRARDDFGCDG